MHFLNTVLMGVFSLSLVSALPTTAAEVASELNIRGLGYQGDGAYVVVADPAGGPDIVQFTPASELNMTDTYTSETHSAVRRSPLIKRATVCGAFPANVDDLRNACVCNENLQGGGKWYGGGKWGWCHWGVQTSYICSYGASTWSQGSLAWANSIIDYDCGNAREGWVRDGAFTGADAAAGRTRRGTAFCAGGFYG